MGTFGRTEGRRDWDENMPRVALFSGGFAAKVAANFHEAMVESGQVAEDASAPRVNRCMVDHN